MYKVKGRVNKLSEGTIEIETNKISFGVTKKNALPSPVDLLVSAFAACCLKNIERFSEFMDFEYDRSEILVEATYQTKPPKIDEISFEIKVKTADKKINSDLLLRNIQKFGTIYNTLDPVCEINGTLSIELA